MLIFIILKMQYVLNIDTEFIYSSVIKIFLESLLLLCQLVLQIQSLAYWLGTWALGSGNTGFLQSLLLYFLIYTFEELVIVVTFGKPLLLCSVDISSYPKRLGSNSMMLAFSIIILIILILSIFPKYHYYYYFLYITWIFRLSSVLYKAIWLSFP